MHVWNHGLCLFLTRIRAKTASSSEICVSLHSTLDTKRFGSERDAYFEGEK